MTNHLVLILGLSSFSILGLVGCSQQGGNKNAPAGATDDKTDDKCDKVQAKTSAKTSGKKSTKDTKSKEHNGEDSEAGEDSDSDDESSQSRPAVRRSSSKSSGSNLTDDSGNSHERDDWHSTVEVHADGEPNGLALADYNGLYLQNGGATSTATGTATSTIISYESDIKKILADNCVDCHKAQQPVLTTWTDVNTAKAQIADSIKSGRMPKAPKMLTTEQIEKVKKWELGGFLQTSAAPPAGDAPGPVPAGDDPLAPLPQESGDDDDEDSPKSTSKKDSSKATSKKSSNNDDGCAPKASTKAKEPTSKKKQAPPKKAADDDEEGGRSGEEEED